MQSNYQEINKFVDEIGKKQIKKGWKVLQKYDKVSNDYYSAFGMYRPTRYCVGKWSVPNKDWGPLCVFDTLRNANRLVRALCGPGYVIMPCEYVPSARKNIWRKMFNGRPSRQLSEMAKGTMLATRVRLLRK